MRAVRRSHAYDALWAEIILEVLSRSKLSPSMACMKTRHCLFKSQDLKNDFKKGFSDEYFQNSETLF